MPRVVCRAARDVLDHQTQFLGQLLREVGVLGLMFFPTLSYLSRQNRRTQRSVVAAGV
jgi:hypothetical protein